MKYVLGIFACVFGITAAAYCSDTCVQTSYGQCFSIHARYAVYTGDGMEVLWPVGTHRLLWASAGTDQLDEMMGDRLSDFYVFGDFVVCPQSKEVPGEMRHVCVKQMSNLRLVRRKQ
jgi:hypothetical protein